MRSTLSMIASTALLIGGAFAGMEKGALPADKAAMQAVAASISSRVPSWSPNSDPCLETTFWGGVVCDDGSVIEIDLSGLNLAVDAQVFAPFGKLLKLQSLLLPGTGLKGSLPDTWNKLVSLSVLDMSNNPLLGGAWPGTFVKANLLSLEVKSINLSGTGITDTWVFQCASMPSPTGFYWAIPCTSSGTLVDQGAVASCDQRPLGRGTYVNAVCTPGSYKAVGSDRVVLPCTVPSRGQFTSSTCVQGSSTVVGSDTVVQACSDPDNQAGIFITQANCVTGDWNVRGSDSGARACTVPKPGEYVTKACNPGSRSPPQMGSDAIIAKCDMTPPASGFFLTQVCSPGGASQVGSNTIKTVCVTPKAGFYVTEPCVPGSIPDGIVGSNTQLAPCSLPKTGQYVSQTCVAGSALAAGSDSQFSLCGTAEKGKKTGSPCIPGSFNFLGTPTVVDASISPSSASTPSFVVIVLFSLVLIVAPRFYYQFSQ